MPCAGDEDEGGFGSGSHCVRTSLGEFEQCNSAKFVGKLCKLLCKGSSEVI